MSSARDLACAGSDGSGQAEAGAAPACTSRRTGFGDVGLPNAMFAERQRHGQRIRGAQAGPHG
jgi:hypothetical protein